MKTIWLVVKSVINYSRMALGHSIFLVHDRIGAKYDIEDSGTYRVFRETKTEHRAPDRTVLVVGFRLKWIGSFPLWHWFFQRLCILTTPFWSGFRGFGVKLWMVDPKTKNYLGIYQWGRSKDAHTYVGALVKILSPVSVPGSVWYKVHTSLELDQFLSEHQG